MLEKTHKTVRVFSNFEISDPELILGSSVQSLSEVGISVFFNKSGPSDLVVVINMVKRPRWVLAPKNKIIKVLQEPTIYSPLSHRFTYRHSSFYSKIFTHTADPTDRRQVKSTCFHGSFIAPDERGEPGSEVKTQLVSIIASTLDMLDGHRKRVSFINKLLIERPELTRHTFGKGRKTELEKKSSGLLPYMYSIAIENTSSPSYVTEKFSDCILSGTVPLYFGASDVGRYFPEGYFIWLPIDDFEKALEVLDSLSSEDYYQRQSALLQAQNLLQTEFSLSSMIIEELDESTRQVGRRRVRILFGYDGLLMFLWESANRLSKLLPLRQRQLIWGVVRRFTNWNL